MNPKGIKSLFMFALLGLMAQHCVGLGIPRSCPGANPNSGKIVFPTQTQYCTSSNLALAQPRDFAENYTDCVAWFNSSHGGKVSLALAQSYCGVVRDLYQSEIFYSVCVDPCTGSAHPTASGCSICSTLTQSLFRRSPIEYGGGKKRSEGKDLPDGFARDSRGNLIDLKETNKRAEAAARHELNELHKRAGGGGKPTTGSAATTTPPPTTTAPVCSTPNPNWPVDYPRCSAPLCNYEYPETCPVWNPDTCPSAGGSDVWSKFEYMTTEQFRSADGAPSFWYYFLAFGPVSMTNSYDAASLLQTAINIYYNAMQCKSSYYCAGCNGL